MLSLQAVWAIHEVYCQSRHIPRSGTVDHWQSAAQRVQALGAICSTEVRVGRKHLYA